MPRTYWIPFIALSAGCKHEEPVDTAREAGISRLDVPLAFVSRVRNNSVLPIEANGREARPGGTLYRRDEDGSVRELVFGPELFDVARPAVSSDAELIVFSAIETELDAWSIWTVSAAGGVATRLTQPEYNPVQDAIDVGGPEFEELNGLGDHSPFFLPDGRIGFASTRYPTLAASCGRREPNIYVMEPDGSDIHRITTTRSGIVDPWMLSDGRIVGAYYSDNMNMPNPDGEGLRELVPQRHWQARYWDLWAFAPDGSGAGRYANVLGGDGDDEAWGVHQARETSDGRIVATVREDATLIDQDSYPSAVTIFEPGWVERHEVEGIGLPLGTTEGYAICPAPVPDGRVVLSWGKQYINADGIEIRPDFDLYVAGPHLSADSLLRLLDMHGSDELDAVPILPWEAEIIEDEMDHVPTDDPREDEGLTARLSSDDVFADLPLGLQQRLSPTPGSAWSVQFWDDSQQFDTDDNPRLNKQMPAFYGEAPVNPDGSFTVEVPADRPFFYALVGPTGVVARMRYSPEEPDEAQRGQAAFDTVHAFLRPDAQASCVGCHQGHMLDPDLALEQSRSNLARLASVALASDTEEEPDFDHGVQRAVDQRLPEEDDRYGWVDQRESEQVGISLTWATELEVEKLLLYPLQQGGEISQLRLLMDVTSSSMSLPFDGVEEYLEFDVLDTNTDSLQIWLEGTPPLGLGEVVVHGEAPVSWSAVTLDAVSDLALDQDLVLSWSDDDHPMLGGFQLLLERDGGEEIRDLGLVSQHSLQLADMVPEESFCLSLRPYDLSGNVSAGAESDQVCGVVPTLSVDSIQPTDGDWGERTEFVMHGRGFRDTDDFMVSLCAYQLYDVTVVSAGKVVGYTRKDRPLEPDTCDLSVSFENGLSATLEQTFTFHEEE